MTELAQQIAIGTAPNQAFTSTPAQNTANLPLNLNNSSPARVKVYVYTFTGSSNTAGFALSKHAQTFYTGGLAWNCQPTSPYALFVTFEFLQDTNTYATSISCSSLSYSDSYGGDFNDQAQDLCIPPQSQTQTYSFTVGYSDNGKSEDPQIVVTPITG